MYKIPAIAFVTLFTAVLSVDKGYSDVTYNCNHPYTYKVCNGYDINENILYTNEIDPQVDGSIKFKAHNNKNYSIPYPYYEVQAYQASTGEYTRVSGETY